MTGLRVAVAVLLLLGMPALARAQAGWYLTPTLSLAEEYESKSSVRAPTRSPTS